MKQKQTHRYREQTCCQAERVAGGMDWEFGVSRCKLLHVEWVRNVHHRELYTISCDTA